MSQKIPTYIVPTQENIKTVTDMREKPVDLVKGVRESGPVYIFHHSEPQAILISPEDYYSLLQRIEDLDDELLTMQLHREALATPIKDLIPLEKVLNDFGK